MELRPPARRREDAAPAAGRPPRRRVPAVARRLAARHGLNEATVAYLVAALVDKSIVSASFTGGAARYDMLDTVREYVLERLAESAGSPPPAARTPNTSRHSPTRRASSCAGRNGCAGNAASSWRTTTSGLRSHTHATRPTLPSRFGSARWGGTSRWPTASPRDGASSSSPSATDDDAPVELRIEQLADLCYIATEEFDLGPALVAGERGLACRDRCGTMAARLRATDARARPRAIGRRRTRCHDGGRRDRRVRGGWRRLGHRGEQPHSRNGCGARRRRLYRHRDGLGRPPTLGRGRIRRVSRPGAAARSVGGRGTRGRRGRGGCVPARVRARRANRVRRPRGVRPRRTRSDRSRERRSAQGRGLQRQALATAEAAQAPLVAAQARVHLARIAAASGNTDEADRLYREVLEWSTMQRPHQARESLFVALAGDPATAAERGLAEIAEPRPDTALT